MKLATIPDAAKTLAVSESRLRRDARAKRVPCIKVGNRTLVDVGGARDLYAARDGLTIKELSAETGLTIGGIRRAIREGWLPCWVDGNRYRFNREDVNLAIEQRMMGAPRKD